MHSVLFPLSLVLTAHAFSTPFTVRTSSTTQSGLARRAGVPISNNGNAAYIANLTIAGAPVSVILDTGSSDLWVSFPGTPPTATVDTGKSLSLSYAVGSAAGNIHTAQVQFDNFTVENQAFLQVADASSFSTDSAYNGLIGLGPNEGSAIQEKLDGSAGDTLLNRIFQQNKTTANYITFLLDRKNDPGEPFTGQFTIGVPAAGYENITSQEKLNVESVHKLLEDQQHWQALTTKDNTVVGPDGTVIDIDSIVPKAPDGQMVAVFDSGFTFSQVPRDMADAIYGRVQGAVYDTKNEWWTVPCTQLINLTFSFGGVAFPIHPLDVVDDNFKILDKSGNHVCIGAFQPITSAFSLFGNFDMIMGMTFLRNAYTLMDFGDWVEGAAVDTGDPYIQLLPLTDAAAAHADFVNVRLNGVDTTGAAQYTLLPASQMQHSPVSAEEKKKKYEEMILSRWPYILVGCLVGVGLIVGLIVWRCCCRKGRKGKGGKNPKGFFEQKSQTYLPLQVQGAQAGYAHEPQGYGQQQPGYGGQQPGYGHGQQQGYGGQPGY
ncbi:aspartic peptidase A1 [Mycena filopes]|nr:aspartic peptidase A1 [Mycena filopes]